MLVSCRSALVLITIVFSCSPVFAALVLNDLGGYSNEFNFLSPFDTTFWTNDQMAVESTTSSPGWYWRDNNPALSYRSGFATNENHGAYSLNNNVSDFDRAMGSFTGGSLTQIAWGIVFQNNSGQAISQVDISYLGEQWRRAATDTDKLHFSFSTSATEITDIAPMSGAVPLGWTPESNLTFTAPLTPGMPPLFDDPPVGSQQSVSGTISVNVPNKHFLALRWYDGDIEGEDAALGIDDLTVSFTATAVPEPSAFLFGGLVSGVMCVTVCVRKYRGSRR